MQSPKTHMPVDVVQNKVKQYTIIGVGNLLQRDDGVGVHAVRALQLFLEVYSQDLLKD